MSKHPGTSVKHPGQNYGVIEPNIRHPETGEPVGHGSFNGGKGCIKPVPKS